MLLSWTALAGIILSGCSTMSQAEMQQTNTQLAKTQQIIVEKLVVQRGHDIFSFPQPSENTGIVVNAHDLYRYAYRRDGEDMGVKNESELPFLHEEQEEGTSENDCTYIRLVQTPFVPEVGMNAFPSKDIVIYVDQKHPGDAFVGVQNPSKREEWHIYKVSGYGGWVQKEIDLYLALYKGL